jgi:uncharacterized membrane protein
VRLVEQQRERKKIRWTDLGLVKKENNWMKGFVFFLLNLKSKYVQFFLAQIQNSALSSMFYKKIAALTNKFIRKICQSSICSLRHGVLKLEVLSCKLAAGFMIFSRL